MDINRVLTPQSPSPVLMACSSPCPPGHTSLLHPFSPLTELPGKVSNPRRGVGSWPNSPFFTCEVSGRGEQGEQGNPGHCWLCGSALLWTADSRLRGFPFKPFLKRGFKSVNALCECIWKLKGPVSPITCLEGEGEAVEAGGLEGQVMLLYSAGKGEQAQTASC